MFSKIMYAIFNEENGDYEGIGLIQSNINDFEKINDKQIKALILEALEKENLVDIEDDWFYCASFDVNKDRIHYLNDDVNILFKMLDKETIGGN